jgi:hypothetical protein
LGEGGAGSAGGGGGFIFVSVVIVIGDGGGVVIVAVVIGFWVGTVAAMGSGRGIRRWKVAEVGAEGEVSAEVSLGRF